MHQLTHKMTFNKTLLSLFFFFLLQSAMGQTSFLPLNSPAETILQRYAIKTATMSAANFEDIRPYKRDALAAMLLIMDSGNNFVSNVDRFNLSYLQSNNLPLSSNRNFDSNKPVLRHFYKSKANFYQVNEPNFNLFVNPVLYLMVAKSDRDEKMLYTNTRALELHGDIDGKLGFYAFISENQMRVAQHENEYRKTWGVYPGAHLTKSFKDGGIDFFQARGYITFSPIKPIGIQFGQDRNFIGNGLRSLLLSDFATDYLFLKINTKVWRFNYMNLFMRLTDRYGSLIGADRSRPYPAKYVALHYLSINIFDNLNIGLFESVTFHDNKKDGRGFDINYLNPVIFYRSVEHQLGDPDKMMVGLNMGYIPIKDIKLYGQFMLNEFRINDLRERNGYVGNKFGYQLGMRYIDLLGLSNVDFQVEYNRVRPYSYAHYEISGTYPVNSYSHYNQPLAHPLGANFSEWIVKVDAQPFSRLATGLLLIQANYGADSSGSNWGGNIFLSYRDYERELGNVVGQGVGTNLLIAELWLSYQIRHNLFIDIEGRFRKTDSQLPQRNSSNLFIGTALRLNLGRKGWSF